LFTLFAAARAIHFYTHRRGGATLYGHAVLDPLESQKFFHNFLSKHSFLSYLFAILLFRYIYFFFNLTLISTCSTQILLGLLLNTAALKQRSAQWRPIVCRTACAPRALPCAWGQPRVCSPTVVCRCFLKVGVARALRAALVCGWVCHFSRFHSGLQPKSKI